MKKTLIALSMFFVSLNALAQNDEIIPVQVKEKFSDFTLENQSGKKFTLSDYLGKKVMLVFIRGKATENVWCPICQYQYFEFLKFEKEKQLKKKYNMEVVFIMPYSKDSLQSWMNAFPQSFKIIEGWKNPKNPTPGANQWAAYCREFFPYSFNYDASTFNFEFPVLFDGDRKLSKGLVIFMEEWGGTKVAQNIPTIFILDEKGKVGFKYFSQYTNDRPDVAYLMKYLDKMF